MCQHSCFSYPACKAHVPYLCTVICDLSGCNVCFHVIWETARFSEGGKKSELLNTKCVFSFSVQLLSEKFLILRRIQRDTVTKVHRASCKVRGILVRFEWNLNFLGRFSKNPQRIKFHENPSNGSQTDTQMDTDGHTDGHRRTHRWTQTDTQMDTDGHTHRQTLRI